MMPVHENKKGKKDANSLGCELVLHQLHARKEALIMLALTGAFLMRPMAHVHSRERTQGWRVMRAGKGCNGQHPRATRDEALLLFSAI